eukprot:CAMPEP_0168721646 /NCGR_PEP_ID=MMETSP0724-20121128/2191_1 /TAXON_ID=265536 /ORGANISM="Amphiprora sp., Strain CCMP467" /LENGTH=220 /DNA_ID=CAMNT_0008768297 /DNA_START=16 /DNA_END=678 /DNA_ORIENTATION=+
MTTAIAAQQALSTVAGAVSVQSSSSSVRTSFYRQAPLAFKRLSETAVLPQRGSELAAGLDLCASRSMTIPKGERALVPTDLAVACPPGTYARIAPRSGLALKKGIDVGAGVIDADYRGPVGVILFNWGSEDFNIQQGDRIAQMILEQIVLPIVEEVVDGELPETTRGAGGFGSTGVSSSSSSSSSTDPVNKKQRTVSPSNGPNDDDNNNNNTPSEEEKKE